MKKTQKLSESELEIMDFIWRSGEEEINFEDLTVHFEDKRWARSTISVFLHRLSSKGYISCDRRGRKSYYRPLVSEAGYRRVLIDRILMKNYGGPIEYVLGMYCGKKELTKEQLSAINDFLKELQAEGKTAREVD